MLDVLRIPIAIDLELTPEQIKKFKALLLEAVEEQMLPCLKKAMAEDQIIRKEEPWKPLAPKLTDPRPPGSQPPASTGQLK